MIDLQGVQNMKNLVPAAVVCFGSQFKAQFNYPKHLGY